MRVAGKALYLDMFEEGYAAINAHTKHVRSTLLFFFITLQPRVE